MSGILFFQTKDLHTVKKFYTDIGATVWLDQKYCIILKHGNLLLGFCQSETCDTSGIITFFYPKKEEVDALYNTFKERAETEPKENEKFSIYHFFAKDPEDRTIEFQCFLHPLNPYESGIEVLTHRRSVRHYQDQEVSDKILWNIFEVCRFSPTSRNSQSYYYVVIRDKKTLEYLASLRGGPSAPIKEAPVAVAVISDPDISGAYIQDGCIAAYHFMLTARSYGLGTCWIAAMDRPEVKKAINVRETHYVITVTPVGHPAEVPEPPPRRDVKEMVSFIG
ncbi:MAG: nitroreductase family protein [Theionarchaea archaeon]|nr:nitroreductase family protein [Theionarchaea archaeon]